MARPSNLSPVRSRPRRRRGPLRILWLVLREIVRLSIFNLAILAGMQILSIRYPYLAIFGNAAPQAAVLTACFALVALLLRLRVWALVALAIAVGNTILVAPHLNYGEDPPGDGSPPLRVMAWNVWSRNEDYAQAAAYLRATHPDVVGLVEATPAWNSALATQVGDLYPYRIEDVDTYRDGQIMILSRLPFERSWIGPLLPATQQIGWVALQWQGRPLVIVVTHLKSVNYQASKSELAAIGAQGIDTVSMQNLGRAQQVDAALLLHALAGLPADLVVMGDFNGAPWSRPYRQLAAGAGLDDRRQFLMTYPAWLPPVLRAPIDHILGRGEIAVTHLATGPGLGSDHLPVLADLVWRKKDGAAERN